MGETDYNALLYDKMKDEQDKYRAWLLSQAKALLRSPCPLADVYKEFMDREVEHMDTIRDSIETRANDVLKRDKNRESR